MNQIKLTKAQKNNLQRVLNAYYQEQPITKYNGYSCMDNQLNLTFHFRYYADEYIETYKLNKTQYKPLEQFFYFEKGRGTVKMKELNITKLMLIEGIADMIKYAIEIQQNIHRIELLEYKRQIDVINIMIAKYKLWTRKDINTISVKELNKVNFFHNEVFTKEDRKTIEYLNWNLAGKKVEVSLR